MSPTAQPMVATMMCARVKPVLKVGCGAGHQISLFLGGYNERFMNCDMSDRLTFVS